MKILRRKSKVESRAPACLARKSFYPRPSALDPRQFAFTLIEIMLSIMIFSIVVAAIYSTWTLVLRSSRVGIEAAAQAQRQRIAMRTIEDALTCIQSFE